ncbi:hypothetical protein DRH14_03820 [Candidatus Shapirobacteria bacterium]|nr:MAG: hypothetical protein DRH14_03820 [Candidatus Shapirobacteria bacterium]
MVMLTKKTIVLAKIEGTYASDSTPSNTDNAIMAFDPQISINADMKERYPANSDISRFPELRGKTAFEIKFSTELKGSGSAGTAPRTSPLWRACGMDEAIVSSTSVAYTPISSSFESCTIYVEIDGILYKALGCVGTFDIDLTAGEAGKVNWTFNARYVLPTDASAGTPTFDSTTPVIVKGTTTTFGAYSAIIEKLALNINNTVAERPDFNQTEGIYGYQVTGRNPEGSMTIEAVLRAESNADFLSYFNSGTVKALSMALGSSAGNICTITGSYGYLRAPVVGDRDGIRTFELPFQLARSSGNDELSIAFT